MFNTFFPIVDTCLSCEIQPDKVVRWCQNGDFLRPVPVFPASRVQHISDMHSKFALRPHCVSKYMVDTQSATAEIRRRKKERRKIETTEQKCNGLPYYTGPYGDHKYVTGNCVCVWSTRDCEVAAGCLSSNLLITDPTP